MKVLAIDTSTLTASVALVDGDAVVAAEEARTGTHSEELMPLVARICAQAGVAARDLDAFAVGAGPGSFTGLRIGMATAKGLAFAAGRPLWLASSLAALALAAVRRGAARDGDVVIPVLDARRREIFAGWYRVAGAAIVAEAPERVLAPADLAAPAGAVVIGDYPDLCATLTTPGAAEVALLALAGDRADALAHGAPVYIRPAEAEVMYPDGVPGALRRRP